MISLALLKDSLVFFHFIASVSIAQVCSSNLLVWIYSWSQQAHWSNLKIFLTSLWWMLLNPWFDFWVQVSLCLTVRFVFLLFQADFCKVHYDFNSKQVWFELILAFLLVPLQSSLSFRSRHWIFGWDLPIVFPWVLVHVLYFSM